MSAWLDQLEDIFSGVLTASWQASVLAFLVLALRWIVGPRLNPRWSYGLWFLVPVRLLLPFPLESPLSVFRFAPDPPAWTQTVLQPLVPPAPGPVANAITATIVSSSVSPENPMSIYSLLALVWLVGVVIFALLTLEVNRRFNSQVAASPRVTDPEVLRIFEEARSAMNLTRRVRLVESARAGSPAIMGLFRPVLFLPANLRERFDPDELRLIFLHELAHLQRGDVITQAIVAFLQIVHWFNPVLWLAFRRLKADRESATDALVLTHAGLVERARYGHMLLKLLEHFRRIPTMPTVVGILENRAALKERFELIASFRRGSYGWSMLGVLVMGALVLVGLTESTVPRAKYPLHITRSVPGAVMTIDSVTYDPQYNMVRASGKTVGDLKLRDFYTRVTVGDSPNSPGSGGLQWLVGLPSPNDTIDPANTYRFGLEIKSPPANTKSLYWHLYFVKIAGQSRQLVGQTDFTTPNPAYAPVTRSQGYYPSPLPLSETVNGVTVTLNSLESGINLTSNGKDAPSWQSHAKFSVTENGQPTDRYGLLDVAITTAAGRAYSNPSDGNDSGNGVLNLPIDGTLWACDGPYMISTPVYKLKGFSPDELFQLTDVAMPADGQIVPIGKRWDAFHSSVYFLGLYGKNAPLPPGLEPNDRASAPCLVFSMSSNDSLAAERNYIQLFQMTGKNGEIISSTDRRCAKATNPGMMAMYVNQLQGSPSVTYTFAMLHQPLEMTFEAWPSGLDAVPGTVAGP